MKQVNGAGLNKQGRFTSLRDEPLAKRVIGLRIPVSQFETVKARGSDWIRDAIAEKLHRESVTFTTHPIVRRLRNCHQTTVAIKSVKLLQGLFFLCTS